MDNTVGQMLHREQFTGLKTSCNLYVPNRHLGFEAERETLPSLLGVNGGYIDVVPDGSLRKYGKELRFTRPLVNDEILIGFKSIIKALKNSQSTFSERTSDHYHVNIRDLTLVEARVLYNNVRVLESTLFNVGKIKFNRKQNSYCVPHSVFYNNYLPNHRDAEELFNFPKYLSFYFVFDKGSIEFRMFEGTNVFSELVGRANLVLEIVENSKKVELDFNQPIRESLKLIAPMSYTRYSSCAQKVKVNPPIRLLSRKIVKDNPLNDGTRYSDSFDHMFGNQPIEEKLKIEKTDDIMQTLSGLAESYSINTNPTTSLPPVGFSMAAGEPE